MERVGEFLYGAGTKIERLLPLWLVAAASVAVIVVAATGCGPGKQPISESHYYPSIVVNGVSARIYLDRRLDNAQRSDAVQSIKWIYDDWNQTYGPMPRGRLLNVIVMKNVFVQSPQNQAVKGYYEEDPSQPLDQIVVVWGGEDVTLPWLYLGFHHVSRIQRDPYELDPANDWDDVKDSRDKLMTWIEWIR